MIASIKNPEKGAQVEDTDAAIRSMLVDDPAIIRGLIARKVSDDAGIEVVATAGLCTAVLPIDGLVDRVMQFFRRNCR